MCGLPLLVQRKLTGLTTSKFVFIPAMPLADTSKPGLEWDIHKGNRVTQTVPASFEHDGRIKNDEVKVCAGLFDLHFELPTNLRVDDAFQLDQGLGMMR